MEEVVTERDVLIEIIQLYKDFPCLWDTSNELYCNRDARKQAYTILKECYSKFDKEATIEDIKKKVENMRAAYRRERKKVENSKSSGAGSNEIYTPSLWYYPYFAFLHEKQNPGSIGIDNIDDEDSDREKKAPEKKKARVSLLRKECELFEKQMNLVDATKKLITREQNSADAFGQSVGSQLKELPNSQRWLAEKFIGDILYYAKTGELNRHTTINLNSQQLYQHQTQSHSQMRLSSSHCRTQWSNSPSPNSFSHSPQYQFQSSHSQSPQHQFQLSQSLSHSPSPQHQVQSSHSPSPQYQIQASHPLSHSPSPQHQIQSSHLLSHSQSPNHQVLSTHSPSPQYQIQESRPLSHSPSSQHQIQSHSQSPNHQVLSTHSPSPQYQIQASRPLSHSPSPQHLIQSSHPLSHSPSPQHQIQSHPLSHSKSPNHQVLSTHSPSPQYQIQASRPLSHSPQHQIHSSHSPSPQYQIQSSHPLSHSQSPHIAHFISNEMQSTQQQIRNQPSPQDQSLLLTNELSLGNFLIFKKPK